jgi:hypothetical protein
MAGRSSLFAVVTWSWAGSVQLPGSAGLARVSVRGLELFVFDFLGVLRLLLAEIH